MRWLVVGHIGDRRLLHKYNVDVVQSGMGEMVLQAVSNRGVEQLSGTRG